MPLFAGKIEVHDQEVREIPVWAKNESDALTYLSSTLEWVGDGVFAELLENEERVQDPESIETPDQMAARLLRVAGVNAILNPTRSPFTGDTPCWHKTCLLDEVLVGAAFNDDQLLPVEAKLIDRERVLDIIRDNPGNEAFYEEEALVKAWNAYFWLEEELIKQFDNIRTEGLSVEQAVRLAEGVSDGHGVSHATMRAAARVLAREVGELRWKLIANGLGESSQEVCGGGNEPPPVPQ